MCIRCHPSVLCTQQTYCLHSATQHLASRSRDLHDKSVKTPRLLVRQYHEFLNIAYSSFFVDGYRHRRLPRWGGWFAFILPALCLVAPRKRLEIVGCVGKGGEAVRPQFLLSLFRYFTACNLKLLCPFAIILVCFDT